MSKVEVDDLGISNQRGDELMEIVATLYKTHPNLAKCLRALHERSDLTEMEKLVVVLGMSALSYPILKRVVREMDDKK